MGSFLSDLFQKNGGTFMNIFEFAKNREKQAEETYRKLAEEATNQGFATIFSRLAEAEKHHYEIIQKMEKAETAAIFRSDILLFTKNTISKLKLRDQNFTAARSQVDIYRAAQDREAESERFYREQAEKAVDAQQGKLFLAIAKEEHQHYAILENIIDYIIFPETHPENAEFNYQKES
jgi:rubrerythrin